MMALRSSCTRVALFLLLLACTSWRVASAQQVDGSLEARVVDPAGKPLAYANVAVNGPQLQGLRHTITDRAGHARLLALPVGVYTVRITHIAHHEVVLEQVFVELGRTTGLGEIRMEPRTLTVAPVVVIAPRVTLDPVHTMAGATLDARDYDALPVDRDYKSIIKILPHANTSYRGDPVNVGGSTGLENMYYIDGVNVTDTKAGGRATSLPYNFVRAVEVKTGGYEAQHGRALGALVNAVTYSGTNDFESSVFGFVQPGSLAMKPRQAPLIGETGAISYDFGARVSGPLIRDRLWYSVAANPRTDQVEKEIVGHGSYVDRTAAIRIASKLTWHASSETRVELSVFGDPTTQDLVGRPYFGGITSVTNPDPQLGKMETGGVVASLRATAAPTRSLLVQASVARQWDRSSFEGATPLGRSQELYLDYVQGSMGGGVGVMQKEDRGRTSLTARGTLMLPRHTLVAGVDYEIATITSGLTNRSISRFDSTTFVYSYDTYSGTLCHRAPAVYLQDNWRLTERFVFNPGLRWSGQYLVGASGRTAQRIADEWQPRLGFSWQLGRKKTQRLFGSYGRFYQTLPMNITTAWFVDWVSKQSYYHTDPRQPGAVPYEVFDVSTLESDYAKEIPGLEAENFDEFTLGYERLLGAETKLTVRGMRRELRSSFQWGVDLSRNPIFVLGTPGEGDFDFLPAPKRQYTALEVAAEGVWRKLQFRTSYVLSRTWGNYPGLYNSDMNFALPGGVSTFYMPFQALNSTGVLPNDHTHVVKLSAASTAGWGLAFGAFVTYESGVPINDFAAGPWGPLIPSFLVPRGTAGRTPGLWNLDLRLAYDLPVARSSRTQVHLDLLNVGNPRRTVLVDETHYMTLDADGNPATPNPMYRHPVAYQPPMAARLGMQVDF